LDPGKEGEKKKAQEFPARFCRTKLRDILRILAIQLGGVNINDDEKNPFQQRTWSVNSWPVWWVAWTEQRPRQVQEREGEQLFGEVPW